MGEQVNEEGEKKSHSVEILSGPELTSSSGNTEENLVPPGRQILARVAIQ